MKNSYGRRTDFPEHIVEIVRQQYIENKIPINAIAHMVVKKYGIKTFTYEHIGSMAKKFNWPKRLSKKEIHLQQLQQSL